MFSRISALITVAIAAAACARMERHTRRTTNSTSTGAGQCNTGSLSCCNSVSNANDVASILDILGLTYDPADSVGLNCIPLNIIGAGEGAACQQQPVCCANNSESGFINFGCSPINLN